MSKIMKLVHDLWNRWRLSAVCRDSVASQHGVDGRGRRRYVVHATSTASVETWSIQSSWPTPDTRSTSVQRRTRRLCSCALSRWQTNVWRLHGAKWSRPLFTAQRRPARIQRSAWPRKSRTASVLQWPRLSVWQKPPYCAAGQALMFPANLWRTAYCKKYRFLH